jgi:hypothetical protein
MSFSSWLRNWPRPAPASRHRAQPPSRRPAGFRPRLEVLEGRDVPSTLTVTNANESGAGSLRAEIAAANGGDTIAFDPALAGQTISLTSGELAITKSLTIQGTPGSREWISGSDSNRVLDITGAANVTLDSLGIGNGWNAEGAGIYNNGGALTISNCSVSDNSTRSPSYNGGGIYNNGGKVTIRNSYLNGNDAEFHYLAGGGNGGAIFSNGGTVTISDSNLSNNDAYYSGGGIFNSDGTVTISHSTLSGGFTYYGGGGIYNTASGMVAVENSSSITGNMGGISYAEDVYNLGVVYLDGTSAIGILNGNPAIPFDPNAPQLQIRDVTVTEGNAGTVAAQFTVTLSTASTQTVTVAYATADGTATVGSDYQSASGALTFAAGESSKTVTVLVNGDRLAEPNETFFVNLGAATNAIILDGKAVGTIMDDEPHISIGDVTMYEGKKGQTTLFVFTVTLSAAYDQPVTMSFKTTDGTAKSGSDYTAKSGTLTFAPGETTKTITIEVKGDSNKEADETFYLNLFGNSTNSLFTRNRGLGTILNDD